MPSKSKALYAVGTLTFFLTIFDGILAYVIPIEVTSQGYSKTALGFIMGTSSLVGAVADIILSKYLKNSNFRKLFFVMYICSLLYALFLWQANILILYLVAMGFWGLYFDFKNFATFNFVGRFTPHRMHAASFGIIDVFKSLGYVIAPLIAGFLIAGQVTDQPFILSLLFLAFSFGSYLALVIITSKTRERLPLKKKNYSLLLEMTTWRKIGKLIAPILIFSLLITMYDSMFWTVGPLISEELSQVSQYGVLFLTLYFLPTVIVGWFMSRITKKYGKKRTAFLCFAIASFFMILVGLLGSSMLVLVFVLISSTFSAVTYPATSGVYADYIQESPHLEQEIEGVSDFVYNIAYVIGPITAGITADALGNLTTISGFGFISLLVSLILLKITPRHIKVPDRI